MKRLAFLLSLSFIFCASPAQDWFKRGENSFIRSGNKAYKDGDFARSETNFKKALEANGASEKGKYNLGNAYYSQDKYKEAAGEFEVAANFAEEAAVKAQSYHNLGNALLEQKQYKQSIDAYKKALRLNPQDMDTKYNLAYAQQMLEQNPDQQQQQNQDQEQQDNEQNQDQQQQNQDQQQQNQDQQQQQNQDQQQQNQDQQQQQQRQPNMSQQQIEQMLEALQYQEEKLQQKLQKSKARVKRVKVEKDW